VGVGVGGEEEEEDVWVIGRKGRRKETTWKPKA
jgi:hypothetical protein